MSDDEVEEKQTYMSPIAHPLAPPKLSKKLYKLCKKATKTKQVRRGVKEVVKAIRKNNKGLVVLAGDIWPIDVISHVPILCEDHKIPYVYVPSKEHLANASQTKRPTSCLMVMSKPIKPLPAGEKPDEELESLYSKVEVKMKELDYIP